MLSCLFFLILFLLLQGFYSGMETGLVSLRKPRVEYEAQKGKCSAKMLLFFMENPGLMISTTLLGVNICVVCASLAAKSFFNSIGLKTPEQMLTGTAILSIIMLTCEIIPKNWFRESPFTRCSMFAGLLYCTYYLLYFPARIFDRITTLLSNFISKGKQNSLETARMREDLRLYFKESESSGKLHAEAVDILDNAIVFHSMTLKDVMSPAEKTPFIRNSSTIAEAIRLCRSKSVTALPISHSDSPDDWFAVFSLENALFELEEPELEKHTVAEFEDRPFRFPANTGIVESIQRARTQSCSMFFVEDQGKIIGVVSLFELTRRLFSPDN